MRSLLGMTLGLLLPAVAVAQTAPPTLRSVWPTGARQGAAVEVTVDGSNIDTAAGFIFSEPGIEAEILSVREEEQEPRNFGTGAPIEDGARRFKVTARLTVASDAPAGLHAFRLRTALGVTNLLRFLVSAFPEATRAEEEDEAPLALPATLVGAVADAGEADRWAFHAPADRDLVFALWARPLGSRLDGRLRILGPEGRELAASDDLDRSRDPVLVWRAPEPGTYVLQVEDGERGGSAGHHYRIDAGPLVYITDVFPLGVQRGTQARVRVRGANIPEDTFVAVAGDPAAPDARSVPVSVRAPLGESVTRRAVAVGPYPEVEEAEPNDRADAAQPLAVPSTVNGRIWRRGGSGEDEDHYRIRARQGQALVFDVAAQQLGSPLDSIIDVLDAAGRPVPRAVVRSIAETRVTLNDPDSGRGGFRIAAWNDLAIDDYVMVGGEILRIASMPTHPDDDIQFVSFRGSRLGMFDTTPRSHSVDTPVYKVEVHPPYSEFPPNGMPLVPLYCVNDDGGPMLGGRDSRVHFTAPADGDYIVRVRDVRGLGGEAFAYRLTVREPQPDFRVTFEPASFNVPRGGRVSVLVTAERIDGFDGPIEVELRGLPEGLRATGGVVRPGATRTVVTVEAEADASLDAVRVSFPSMLLQGPSAAPDEVPVAGVARLTLAGSATIDGRRVVREAGASEPIAVVALAPPPDLVVTTDAREVTLPAGGTATLTIAVDRRNGFAGRVPISVMNLPHGVRVDDVGLNGVMITEEETSRTIHLVAEPWVPALTGPVLVAGRVEVNSPLRNETVAAPVRLTVQRPGDRTAR